MAKRKRLTPARPNFLTSNPEIETNPDQTISNTRSTSVAPPIAQVAGDASASAALSELSDIMAQARADGRIVDTIALTDIDTGHLVRDRLSAHTDDMDTLISSLKARGQQTPVEVVDRGEGQRPRYGLISGWRRVAALKAIEVEQALAIVRHPKTSSDAYVAMVEENEIRADISFYERARIVVKALEQDVYSDPKTALQTLFANVSRAKRSKIKSFMTLVKHFDGVLQFPGAISERAGLELVKRLQADVSLSALLIKELRQEPASRPEQEVALLLRMPSVPQSAASDKNTQPQLKRSKSAYAKDNIDIVFDAKISSVSLSGAGIDKAFVADLSDWLKTRA